MTDTTTVRLEGWWTFGEGAGTTVADASGNGRPLTANSEIPWTEGSKFGGAVELDGASQWLSTGGPVLRTDAPFSVAAWVRLDSAKMPAGVALPEGEYALTAVSQSGEDHSPFYLGARLIPDENDENHVLRWNFTASPVDGSVTGEVDWEHAAADPVTLDEWVLLVGVYDLAARRARIYLPGAGTEGSATLPEGWPAWNADGGLQVGFGRFLGGVADQWPGAIGAIRAYSGVLTAADAESLYTRDSL